MNPIFKNAVTEHQVLVREKIVSYILDAIGVLQWIAIGLLSTIPFYFGSKTDDKTF